MLPDSKDFKKKQQDLTELNSDGNRTRGRYGEDESHLNREKDEENSDEEAKPGG